MAGIGYSLLTDPAEMQDISQQRKLADILRQQSMQAPEGQMVSGHYIAPSITQGLARLLQGYQANRINKSANAAVSAQYQKQIDMLKSMAGVGDGASAAPPAVGGGTTDLATSVGAGFGDITNPQTPTQNQPTQNSNPSAMPIATPAQSNGMYNIPGMSAQQKLAYLLTGQGDKLAASSLKNYEPDAKTETEKLLTLSGIDPNSPQGKQFILTKLQPPVVNRGYGILTPDANGELQPNAGSMAQIGQTEAIKGQFAPPVNLKTTSGADMQMSPTEWQQYQTTGQVPPRLQGAPVGAIGVGQTPQQQAYSTESGKAPFETVPTQQASGATVPTFKSQLPGYPGGQAQPNLPPPQGQIPQEAPASAGATFDMGGRTKQQIIDLAQKIQDPAQKADYLSRLSVATPQDFASPQVWDTMPKVQNPRGVGQSTYQEGLQKGQGEQGAKLYEKFGTQADAANQRIALNNQALDLVDKADVGPGATWTADLKNIVQKYVPGISESSFSNTPSATIALQKDLVNAATQKAKQQFGSRITQSEVNLMLTRGAPNVSMPQAAIKYLIQSDNAQANYTIKQAQDFGKYIQNGGDPYQFEGWYARSFPMNNDTQQVHLNNGNNVSQTTNSGWSIKKIK